ncbi:MAG: type III pantothenate kinase [Candidatus Limnocylindrales bacterium]
MVIAIDVGNSAVKVARVAGGGVVEMTRLATASGPDRDAIGRLLGTDDGAIAMVSVVPGWSTAIEEVAALQPGRPLVLATHRTIPISVRVAEPELVGADRLLGAWASLGLVGAPCIVVDVGTATTIDVVDADGAFVGGAILPGPVLGMRSLARGTALLPPVPLELPADAIGRDTLGAIASGVILGHREAIGGLVDRMAGELGGDRRPRVVLTGGDATVLGSPDWAERVEPELLLRGLGVLAEQVLVERRVGSGT